MKHGLRIIFLLALLAGPAGQATGTGPDDLDDAGRGVAPSAVFQAVQGLQGDLELLRRYMGGPAANALDLSIHDVAPHDVYFQAMTLFEKTNRLSFEVVRWQESPPPWPRGIIRPDHVLLLVKGAHRALRRIMVDLDISIEAPDVAFDETKTPTDVFVAILATNRQLNQLLERRFSPSDTYEVVTLAIGYAARQLARHPGATRIPDPPAFEKEMRPSDVYVRLVECLEIVSHIYRGHDLETLAIDASLIDEGYVTPSDVYDIASLVVARLDFLHGQLGVRKMPRGAFYPGRKYPSDVYQQAGILKAQLTELARRSGRDGLSSKRNERER